MSLTDSGSDTATEMTARKGFALDTVRLDSVPIMIPRQRDFTCSLQKHLNWMTSYAVPHELAPCVANAGLIIPSTTTRGRTIVDQIINVILDCFSTSFQSYFL